MKILLIDPPFYRLIGFYNRYFPLGLVSVGTVLRKAGHEVVVYGGDYNEDPSATDYARLPEYYPRYLDSFRDSDHPLWLEVRRTIEQARPDVVGISVWTTYAASALRVAEISKVVLERMNKGITLDQARKAAGLLRKAGIYWTGYFLSGTPGETLEDIYRTLDFMYEIRPDFVSLGHWRRILNRARARTAQYVRSPRVLYTDFREYLSWR